MTDAPEIDEQEELPVQKAAIAALQESEVRFRTMSDALPLGVFVADHDGNCNYSNAAYQEISGLSLEQTLGMNWSSAIHPEDRLRVMEDWRKAIRENLPLTAEVRFLRSDGTLLWTRLNAAALPDGSAAHGFVQTVEDISDRKRAEFVLRDAEDALFEARERAQVTLDSIGDGVLTTNLQGNVTYLNQVAEKLTGWARVDALGRPVTEVFKLVDVVTHQSASNPAQRAIAEDRTVGLAMGTMLIRRDGADLAIEDSAAPIHDRNGVVTGAVIVFHDSRTSHTITQQMTFLAQHDFLTKMPNRLLLMERLQQSIGLARRHRKQVALLFLDLDHFKHINDSLGHEIGDQLLRSVANRMVDSVRATDTVCRQGGDEFVILLSEIEQPQDAAHIAQKLISAFARPHNIQGHALHITLSIGVGIYPDDGDDINAVLKSADTAMYHAKTYGRNNYQFFRADMNASAGKRLIVEAGLHRALAKNEFHLFYQPKFNLASGAITGVEALIRWQDPEHGPIAPNQFISIAEDTGLIVPIGRWVLQEACRQNRAWQDAGLDTVPVAINVSALEFRHPEFLEGVDQVLAETGLASDLLQIELTESVLMRDTESTALVLEGLKARKIQVSIDDFGTGHSSLSYLKRFAVDTLKIDKSFVADITNDPVADVDGNVIAAVIGLGRTLRQRVVAEGVETFAQLAFLKAQRCEEGQGFHLSYPLSANDFASLLNSGTDAGLTDHLLDPGAGQACLVGCR